MQVATITKTEKAPEGHFRFISTEVYLDDSFASQELKRLYDINNSGANKDAGFRARYVNGSRDLSVEKLDDKGGFYNCVAFYRLQEQKVIGS